LELSSNVEDDYLVSGSYHKGFTSSNEFTVTSGVYGVSTNESAVIVPLFVFPINASKYESHLELPMNWTQNFENDSRVSYVGIRINHELANRIFRVKPE